MVNIYSTIPMAMIMLFCLISGADALNKFGVLEVAKSFADDILSAGRGEIPRYNAGIFTKEVQGQVDVFGKLNGREAATDFIFGMFATSSSDPTAISPIGKPTSYNVTALSVQHDVTSLSIIYQLEYPALDRSWPFQIDGWLRVNGDREIEAFDLVFRHFPWLMEEVTKEMGPMLSVLLGPIGSNMTAEERLSTSLVQSVCKSASLACEGGNQPYPSLESCVTSLSAKPLGEWYHLQDDTMLCRAIQAPLIARSAERYCPSLSSTSAVCAPRDYSTSINETTPKGWLAAKYVSPQNEEFVKNIYAVSGEPLHPLLEVGLAQDELHSWDPTLYATMTFVYFIFFYAFAHVTFFVFNRLSPHFRQLTYELRKNVVMYTMTIIFTTIALALQLSPLRWAFGHYTQWEIQTMRTAAVLLSSLYVFELVFRFNMRYPLVAHHFFTILAISLGVTLTEYTQSPTYVVSSIIWMLQATTEQPTFIGLLGYRMNWSKPFVAKMLKFAAIQTFAIKTASAIGVFVYWAINQRYHYASIDIAWSVLTILIVVGLMATQVYVTYMIGVRIEKKYRASGDPASSNAAVAKRSEEPPIPMSSGRSSMTYNNPMVAEFKHESHEMQNGGDDWFSKTAATGWKSVPRSEEEAGLRGPNPAQVAGSSIGGPSSGGSGTATPMDAHGMPGGDHEYGYGQGQWNRPYGGV